MAFEKIEYSPGDVLTSDQMNKIQDVIVANEGNIEQHLIDTNPHNVTAEQVGAAPAGYGLGGVPKKLTSADNIDNVKTNGWYEWVSADLPSGTFPEPYSSYRNQMRVWGNTAVCCQEIIDMTNGSDHGVLARRTIYGSTVHPWEWVNPPMILNTEYRTTERYGGLAVYVKRTTDGVREYIKWRCDGETTWHDYADIHGAVKLTGDTMSGQLNFADSGGGTNIGRLIQYGDTMRMRMSKTDNSYSDISIHPNGSPYFDKSDGTSQPILHGGNIGTYAAPAGYGLGALPKLVTNYDEVKTNGWYWNVDGSVQGAPEAYTWACHVTTFSSNIIFQDFYAIADPSLGGFWHARRCYHPVVYPNWSPVEWENPPMRTGVEYRTTERANGYPVYKKLISLGGLSAGASTTVAHGISHTLWYPISMEIVDGLGAINGLMTSYDFNKTNIIVTAPSGWRSSTTGAFLKYYVPTD